jgi:hypothetical protein
MWFDKFGMASCQKNMQANRAKKKAQETRDFRDKSGRSGMCATEDDVARWQEELDELMAERARLMNQRRELTVVVGQHRTAMIKLGKAYENLQRSQANLQSVVDGRNPASGFEGGLFPVA